jgi:hypothetical protein
MNSVALMTMLIRERPALDGVVSVGSGNYEMPVTYACPDIAPGTSPRTGSLES